MPTPPYSRTRTPPRYLISGQANIIFQAHGPFHSPYEGVNSLLSRGEYKTSLIGTFYLGYQLNKNPRYATDAILDVESAGRPRHLGGLRTRRFYQPRRRAQPLRSAPHPTFRNT